MMHGSLFANHLWQSTLFAVVALLLTLALRKNGAQIRYWVWLAASLKFLVPFSLLVKVGSLFEWRAASSAAPGWSSAIEQVSQPFALPAISAAARPTPAASSIAPALLVTAWFLGCALVLFRWWSRQRRVRAVLRAASPLQIPAPIAVMSSPTSLEPGVFGILRPVLLLPEGIADRFTAPQLQAILAHELCHVRRHDNLTAAIHMVVEAVVWFHPLVWWIGARMIEERELACDEEVLRLGNRSQVYAEGILNVCKFYVESPLRCASGVTGADLKKRIEAIMTNRFRPGLTLARKLLLAGAGIAAVVSPIFIGMMNTPRMRAQQGAEPSLKFAVASIKMSSVDGSKMGLMPTPGGGVQIADASLQSLVAFAYDVQESQISGGPKWLPTSKYNIIAKPEHDDDLFKYEGMAGFDRLRLRMRSLLTERFQLVIHKEPKTVPVYALVIAKGGPKLQHTKEGDTGPARTMRSRSQIDAARAPLKMLTAVLTNWLGRPVVDRTGLTGLFTYKVTYAPESGGPPIPPMPGDEAPEGSGASIFTALQEQLGLKLEPTRGPIDTIVIDRAQEPTEN